MTIGIGASTQVDSASITQIGIQTFDATNGVEFYDDAGTLYARYLAISGLAVTTPESRVSVDASYTNSENIDTCRVSATSVLIVYRQSAVTVARLVTLSGTTLTVQAATTLTDVAVLPTIEPFSSTHILLTYQGIGGNGGGDEGKARVLTFSGMTVVENTRVIFSEASAAITSSDSTPLTSTKAVVGWIGRVAAKNPMAVVLTLSGTTLTVNTRLQIDSPNVAQSTSFNRDVAVSAFSTTLAMFAYKKDPGNVRGAILTESAASLSAGTVAQVGADQNIDIRNWDSNNAVYAEVATGLTVKRILRSGTTFTVPDSATLTTTTASQIHLADISATEALVGFEASSADAAVLLFSSLTKLWKRNSAGAWGAIGDGSWTDPVRHIYVKPGTDDGTIWAAVGAKIYRTDDGGDTTWTLKATLTFEPEGIDGLPADDGIIAYTKDAAGTNRFAIITGTTVVYRDSGHSTTGRGTIARGVA